MLWVINSCWSVLIADSREMTSRPSEHSSFLIICLQVFVEPCLSGAHRLSQPVRVKPHREQQSVTITKHFNKTQLNVKINSKHNLNTITKHQTLSCECFWSGTAWRKPQSGNKKTKQKTKQEQINLCLVYHPCSKAKRLFGCKWLTFCSRFRFDDLNDDNAKSDFSGYSKSFWFLLGDLTPPAHAQCRPCCQTLLHRSQNEPADL